MDVVEAIDAWIDEQIDDLTDDELESILEILDVVSASELANIDSEDVYIDDLNLLIDETGGSPADRVFTDAVLRASLFNEPFNRPGDVVDTQSDGRDPDSDLDDTGVDDTGLGSAAFGDLDDDDVDPEDGNGFEGSDDENRTDFDDAAFDYEDDVEGRDEDSDSDNDSDSSASYFDGPDDAGFLDDINHANMFDEEFADINGFVDGSDMDDASHQDFLDDLANSATAPAPLVELRPFDDLGPAFLPESTSAPASGKPSARRRSAGKLLLPVFMIVGLAVFAFGMLQLLSSLGEGNIETVATEAAPTSTAAPEATAAATAEPATPEPVDPSAPTPTPTPEPTPPPPIGIRLVAGDVMVATYPEAGAPAELSLLYEGSGDFESARDIAWLTDGLGIVDTDGNVLIVDPDERRPKPTMIYEAGDDIEEAVKIASVNGFVAVLTEDGNIYLAPTDGDADPDDIEVVWDAEAEEAEATDLAAVEALVPFVLDDGNALLAVIGDDISVLPLWTADEQPPAFNLSASKSGILLGVGSGAVARYRLGEFDGATLQSVWDPFSGDEQPAIGYSPAGDSTAVILGDGAIVLTDSDNSGRVLWDPEETEIRAFVAVGDADHVVVLLENGSVVRIPLNPDEFIESIWDVTDETLSPATQLVVRPFD